MIQARSRYLTLCNRSVHVLDWGREDAPPVILWHGFARNAHDFDYLAASLAGQYRLIAPDTIGRGLSEWSPVPDAEYTVPFYARQAVELVEQLGFETVRWVGTSMGGLIGMVVATVLKQRMSHLVLNDVGPAIAPGAVDRILTYAGNPPAFATLPELEQYFRTIYAPFGIASDEGWRRLAETSARRLPDGRLSPHYDPQIAAVLGRQNAGASGDAWPLYDQIVARTMLIRGAVSDLLEPATRR